VRKDVLRGIRGEKVLIMQLEGVRLNRNAF
jgi:hypothetical protein